MTDTGALYCWGNLGAPESAPPGARICELDSDSMWPGQFVACSSRPVRMPVDPDASDDTTFVRVDLPCALTSRGGVWCYRAITGVYAPTPLPVSMVDLAAGPSHACGLERGGSAWCWGVNTWGQLGNGTRTVGLVDGVQAVQGGSSFTRIVVGRGHSCGLTAGGEVFCWGLNNRGQAGVPVLTEPWVPMRIRGQG